MKKIPPPLIISTAIIIFNFTCQAQQLTSEIKQNEIGIVTCRTVWNTLLVQNKVGFLSGFSYQRSLGKWNGRASILYNQFGQIEDIRSEDYSPSSQFETNLGIGRTFFKKSLIRPFAFTDLSFQSGKEYRVINGFAETDDVYNYYKNLLIYGGAGIEFEPIKNVLLKYEARIGVGYYSQKITSVNNYEPFNEVEYLYNGKTGAFDPISALSFAIRF